MTMIPQYQIDQSRTLVANPAATVHPFMLADAWSLLKQAQGHPVNFRSPAFDGRFSAAWLPDQLEIVKAARTRALCETSADPLSRIAQKVRSIATAKGYALRPQNGGAA